MYRRKALDGEILEEVWEQKKQLKSWTMWAVQDNVMFFCLGSKRQKPFMQGDGFH